MNSQQNESQPPAQAGQSREAGWVAGAVGVLHSSVDLWESITHGEPREGTCADAVKRSAGAVMAGQPDSNTAKPPKPSTPAPAEGRKPTGERHSESRVRENRTHGLMRGGKQPVISSLSFSTRRFPPTLLGDATSLPQ
jgi:hypothetical protein